MQGHDAQAGILGTYRAANCDLLVMGTCSRGHLRERIHGGVTHEVRLKKGVPVLIRHA